MDIFKLIYEHDLRLESLRERHSDRSEPDVKLSLETFLKPDPTYSRFYLSGSRHTKSQRFGLNTLNRYDEILQRLESVLAGYRILTEQGEQNSLRRTVEELPIGPAVLFAGSDKPSGNLRTLALDRDSNVGQRKDPLREALEAKELVLYKEPAHHGFDLHLFSQKNIYRQIFFPFKQLLDRDFRFFSINGKRLQSERKFYFETWALEKPPHGIEEVFEETVL